MSAPPASANIEPLVSRSAAAEKIARALRLFIGRGRKYSVREVEIGAGVPARAIECAMVMDADNEEWRRLPQEHLLSLQAFLGAEFTMMIIAPLCQQGAYPLPDSDPGASAISTMRAAVDMVGGDTAQAKRAAALHLAGQCGQALRAAA